MVTPTFESTTTTSPPDDLVVALAQAPLVVRGVATRGDRTAHIDLGVREGAGVGLVRFSTGVDETPRRWRPEVVTLAFDPGLLWPVLSAHLPADAWLRATPAGGGAARGGGTTTPDLPADEAAFVASCHTSLTIGIARRDPSGEWIARRQRLWLVADSGLYAASDRGLLAARRGAVAETFIWDVSAVLDAQRAEVA